ncbi:MAG: hypothetical protein SWK90_12260 [Chloroflexota bacterium]|nr:hypothetical protein [Chloroflexota bacterium]
MPECIVCKGYYEMGRPCKRCGSDNTPWVKWHASEPVEQGGLRGLLRFAEPHLYAPFLIAIVALGFGLMGIAGLWRGVNLATRLLATAVTVGGCLVIIQGVYERRHGLRETELLARVRTGKLGERTRIRLSAQLKTILTPALVVGLMLLLPYALVQSATLWDLSEWLLLEHEDPPPPVEDEVDFKSKVIRAWPLICMGGYTGFFLSLAYSSSMMLARRYVRRINQVLPHPIFLQDEKLAHIVRKEAEVELGRIDPKNPNVVNYLGYVKYEEETDPRILHLAPNVDVLTTAAGGGSSSPRVEMWGQAATWVWDELERTEDGGIKMKVARQEMYQLPEQTKGSDRRPIPRVRYVVRADPWGHVIQIARTVAEAPKKHP